MNKRQKKKKGLLLIKKINSNCGNKKNKSIEKKEVKKVKEKKEVEEIPIVEEVVVEVKEETPVEEKK